MSAILGLIFLVQISYDSIKSAATTGLAEQQTIFIQPILKDAPPQFFIFESGAGPYAQLGGELARLKDFMAEKKIAGQLAAVFYDDRAKVPAESLRWEIGVLTTQQLASSEPYSQKIISGRKVASLVVEGLLGQNEKHYGALLNFIRQKRYIFRPPVMEIFTGPTPDSSKTEIQMPVAQRRRVR